MQPLSSEGSPVSERLSFASSQSISSVVPTLISRANQVSQSSPTLPRLNSPLPHLIQRTPSSPTLNPRRELEFKLERLQKELARAMVEGKQKYPDQHKKIQEIEGGIAILEAEKHVFEGEIRRLNAILEAYDLLLEMDDDDLEKQGTNQRVIGEQRQIQKDAISKFEKSKIEINLKILGLIEERNSCYMAMKEITDDVSQFDIKIREVRQALALFSS